MTLKQRYKQYKKFKEFLGPKVFKLFIAAIGVGILSFAVEASFVLISQGFLNALGLVSEEQLKLPDFYPRGIVPSILLLCLFGLGRGLVLGLKKFLATYTSHAFSVQQRRQLFSYGLQNADKVSTSDVISVFGDRVRESGQVLQHFSHIASLLVSSSLLFVVGLKLAPLELITGLVLLGIIVAPLNRTNKIVSRAGKALLKDWDKTNRYLVSGLKNFVLLKIYKQIDRQVEGGRASLDAYLQRQKTQAAMASLKSILPTTAGTFVIAALTLVSLKFIGTEPIMLLAFFYIFVRISQSMGELMYASSALRFNMPSFKALYAWHLKFLDHTRRQEVERARVRQEVPNPIHIELRSVSFRYSEDSDWIIRDKNLRIRPGQPLIIKGPSGAGKSTLLKIILGLERPQQGSVSIGGVAIENVSEDFWDRVSYVGPEPFLIEGTIRANLLYGHPQPEGVSDEDIEKALQQAQLWGEAIGSRDDIDRPLGDHVELSTGQRQRLSIARALLRQADLYIWDEATANLDRASEARIVDVLKPLVATRTSLIVTHKDSFDALGTPLLLL
jgi:ABC-type multidrug transport system fused ATPase/permease subunit